ncbi:tigger transposable element-derived protein [Plakobranchus ocellatus]|uniref:Tigger transposable element-derived protein n=1 Tax=Plakobranchus ocellatus TaxID=259542 RepID=A0AAV4CAL3_9GAST|nr:tigger transposable element-derived protein [Plakobranchus ocellatus]
MRGNNIPISGPMMKTKATSIAETLGKNNWECNEDWTARFKKRHHIVFKTLCGESSSVDDASLNQWRDNVLEKTLSKYEPFDVYNADETGLFWRLLPNKTMDFKGQEGHGGEAPKDRITVLTCANMDGSHKLPLFVIGKFNTPRCFKGVRKLPVCYQSNSKAWMTAAIFTEWIQEFDRAMHCQKRKVLLTLDNCTAHPKVTNLKAVELLLLPPNTTSKSQPCDMGIINNVKCHYRGTLLKRLIDYIDEDNDFNNFKLTLLDAAIILKQAWEKVVPATIRNCFKKAGFQASESETETVEEESDVEPFLSRLLVEYGIPDSLESIENLDKEVPTAPSPSEAVNPSTQTEEEREDGNGPTAETDEDNQGENVATAMKTLSQYFMQKGITDDLLTKVQKTIDCHIDSAV